MSKIIASAAIRGANAIVTSAEMFLNRAVGDKGINQEVGFPDTAYYLPMAYTLMGVEVKTLKDMFPVLEYAKSLLHDEPGPDLWRPYLGDALDCGIATLLSEELIMALRYLYGIEPQPGCNGFFTDTTLRSLGIQLVDGRMPGFATIIGAAPDNKTAVEIIRELQKRNILIFVGSHTYGRSFIDQLIEEEVQMGWDTYIVPYGRDTLSGIYPLNWAIRAALTFGGHKKGEGLQCLKYCQNRVFAFAMTFGWVDDLKYATGAGAINMGFPVIADTNIPEIRPTGICTYEHVVRETDYEKLVSTCIEVRGVKVKISEVDIPVLFGAAFEGERVRKAETYVQFGGKYTAGFEYLRTKDMNEVEADKVEVIGPEADEIEEGSALPLGIVIDVAGRNMNPDFEPVMERQIHTYINHAMGIWHMGQRDLIWMRISKEAFHSGFRIKHFGEILRAMILEDYGEIVDKVQVTLYTREEDVRRMLPEAKKVHEKRDARVADMTDESVDIFYSCTLCQSFAPNHVCIITPERLGLCGAYNWLDGKASHQINPAGPNQPLQKNTCIDPLKGQWKGVNEFVYQKSNQTIEIFNAYSLMEFPETSCGCFECIVAVVPEANGVMIVNREFSGDTPCGMPFTTLAGVVGGGVQTPGFLGVGRLYIVSKKFIAAEGGLPRVVWLTKELKADLEEKLQERAEEIGMPDLFAKIADETIATSPDELLAYLEQVGHPALTMESII